MKTTLDLPDALLQEIKIRAVQQRKPLKHYVTALLIKGLEAPPPSVHSGTAPLPAGLEINDRGFPVFRCGPGAPATTMSAEELIALEQQALESEDAKRAGITS